MRVSFAFLLPALAVFAPSHAFAQASTLGEVMCNASANIVPFAYLFNGIAYILGAVVIGSGLLHLVRHHENPRETRLHHPIAKLVAGACLLALPSFIHLATNSIFNYSGGGGIQVCAGEVPENVFGGGLGLDGLMVNLIGNIKDPMTFMLSMASITIGVFLVIRGLMKASNYGQDPRESSVSKILVNIIIGVILFVIGQSLNTIMGSVFGSSYVADYSVINWGNLYDNFGVDMTPFHRAVIAALTFFQLIGFIAFIRGWLILKNVVEGSGQATMAQGFTHILGGVAAINIYTMLQVFDNTFGTGFLS